MHWFLNIGLLVSLSGHSGASLLANLSQDEHTEQGEQSQPQEHRSTKEGVAPPPADGDEARVGDLSAIESLNAQAVRYQDKGQYQQAEPLFRQALTLCEQFQEAVQPLIW